jgi:hypothetical protein
MARAQKAADKAAIAAAKQAQKEAEKVQKAAQKAAQKAVEKAAVAAAKQAEKAQKAAEKAAEKAAIPKRPRGRPRKNPLTGSVASGNTGSVSYEAGPCFLRAEEAGPALFPPPSPTGFIGRPLPDDDAAALRARLAALEATNADLRRRLQSIRDMATV